MASLLHARTRVDREGAKRNTLGDSGQNNKTVRYVDGQWTDSVTESTRCSSHSHHLRRSACSHDVIPPRPAVVRPVWCGRRRMVHVVDVAYDWWQLTEQLDRHWSTKQIKENRPVVTRSAVTIARNFRPYESYVWLNALILLMNKCFDDGPICSKWLCHL